MLKEKQRTKLLIVLAAIFFLHLDARAAAVEDIPVQGTPVITEKDAAAIERIPGAVVDLFKQKGGHILFVSSPLEKRYGSFDFKVYGLYYQPTHRIYIRNGAEFGGVLAHELGHFLYCDTYPSWPQKSRGTICKYGGDDPNEYFAQAYSSYCAYGSSGSPDIDSVIEAVNLTAEKLLEKTKGLGIAFKP